LFGLKRTFGSNVSTIFILMTFFILRPLPSALSQIPQGFNYQAIARDGDGNLITSSFSIKVEIQNLAADTIFWIEEHNVTPNEYGLISFIVGQGTPLGGRYCNDFEDIDWASRPRYLKTSANTGSGYTEMGTTQIMSVPYSLISKDVKWPVEKLEVKGSTTEMDEALFEVKNKDGQTIFAVYNQGVRIYVDDAGKGPKGGFTIGGFGTDKGTSQPYFIVKPDTVRVYINQSGKGAKGGFAIGGYGVNKTDPQNFLFISDDSVRIWVDNAKDDTPKGAKGGFAIGGYGISKGHQKLLTVSDDSVRIYINDTGKGPKGGFAIGGFDKAKGEGNNTNFFNVSIDANDTINPSQPRILWYPLKNAFLTGQVLIEHPDSVGENSFAAGYESKPKGDYSQALGYKARTEGISSTAIGNYSFAKGSNSFAFGDSAYVSSSDGYAIGAGAMATGTGAFAVGSKNREFGDNYTLSTSATGNFSMAMGLDADAEGLESFASGISVKAQGDYSVALGRSSTASGDFSMALQGIASGVGSIAIGGGSATAYNSVTIGLGTSSGWDSFVIGNGLANNDYSYALGYNASATGDYAIAAGMNATAQASGSFVIGYYNKITGTKESLVSTDPAFVIGNGTYLSPSNAFTVLKNGYTAVGHDNPTQMLDVNGQVRIRGGSPAAGEILTASDANGNATWAPFPSHTHGTSDIISGTLPVTRGGTGSTSFTAYKLLAASSSGSSVVSTSLHWDGTNLGVANSSPNNNLDVSGTAEVTGAVLLASGSGNVTIGTTVASVPKLRVYGNMSVGTYNAATTNGLAVSGNVGIGTSNPSQKLHIENTSGSVTILVNGSSGNSTLEYRVSNTYVGAFGANLDDDYIFMYSGGNVSLKNGYMGIGNTNPGQKLDITGGYGRVESGYSWLTNSDIRYKKNITELQESLEKLMYLRGVRFDLADDEDVVEGQGKYIGFIAQDLEQVFPEFVVTGDDGYKSVAYDKIGPVLVEAIKEQQKHIEAQQQQIDELKMMIAEMQKEIASSLCSLQ
jgi:hypothetical protein